MQLRNLVRPHSVYVLSTRRERNTHKYASTIIQKTTMLYLHQCTMWFSTIPVSAPQCMCSQKHVPLRAKLSKGYGILWSLGSEIMVWAACWLNCEEPWNNLQICGITQTVASQDYKGKISRIRGMSQLIFSCLVFDCPQICSVAVLQFHVITRLYLPVSSVSRWCCVCPHLAFLGQMGPRLDFEMRCS